MMLNPTLVQLEPWMDGLWGTRFAINSTETGAFAFAV